MAMTTPDTPTSFTRRQVADAVGVTPDRVRNWERAGWLVPAVPAPGFGRPTPTLYSPTEVALAKVLRDLTRSGFELKGLDAAVKQLALKIRRQPEAWSGWVLLGLDGSLELVDSSTKPASTLKIVTSVGGGVLVPVDLGAPV